MHVMHKDTKSLIVRFVMLVVVAGILWFIARELPHWLHHEGLEGEELKAHEIHTGLKQAMVYYLAIACSIYSVVSLGVMLLTVVKLDKERTEHALQS